MAKSLICLATNDGKTKAYVGDTIKLVYNSNTAVNPSKLNMTKQIKSIEPYAVTFTDGDTRITALIEDFKVVKRFKEN